MSIGAIKAADRKWKPGQFDQDAIMLASLSENRGREITRAHLRQVGMGDPSWLRPLCVGTIPRLAESLSVLYRVPATRSLKTRAGDILPDDDEQARTFAEVARRMLLDSVWGLVDLRRNLVRQCVVSFFESHAQESVQARVHWPFEVFRCVTPSAADVIDQDEAIAIQILHHPSNESESLYQLWQHEEDGSWRCWIVNGAGAQTGVQPYGEEGRPPFDGLPMVLVTDTLAAGAAWLPIPESRLDFALNVNGLANDLAFIVKHQAHAIRVLTSPDPGGVPPPTEDGPDRLQILPNGSDMKVLTQNPQISAINETIENELSQLCLSESLPADYFKKDRAVHTGPALKIAERDLESRRQRQAPLAVEAERRAFRKIRAIHNAYAGGWGVGRLNEGLELVASFSRQWQPTDPRELQEVYFKDLAIGATSMVRYIQDRYNVDRTDAVDIYTQVQAERVQYPVLNAQNPGAMVGDVGPLPALGEGGATDKVAGAFNPDVASSVEGASVTDAVLNSGEAVPAASPPSGAPSGEAPAPAATPGSSAATLEVGKANAAVDIVVKVAKRELEREAGIGMLQVLFSLSPQEAERVMGAVGRAFFAEESAPMPGVSYPLADD